MNTLFASTELTIELFQRFCELTVSKQFVDCADSHLTDLLMQKTGLVPGKNVSVSIPSDKSCYEKGQVSRVHIQLVVNHNWNPITILWASKSGRIYDVNDNGIDCTDIEFGFENLDPLLYHKQLYPKAELPFKLKGLTYELVVSRLNMDCTVEMLLKKEAPESAGDIAEQTDEFIDDFNTASEKRNRKDGVVHNWTREIEDNRLIYEIDTGFSGPVFIKKLLQFLSKLNAFEKVELK